MQKLKSLNFGYTLAEVLITLGIVGVVAAITVPNLIGSLNYFAVFNLKNFNIFQKFIFKKNCIN